MSKTTKRWLLVIGIVIVAFVVGIYLQDRKHNESTKAAWESNRFNMERFNKIRKYSDKMNSKNWFVLRDSIEQQVDSFKILRFRKEMDSLKKGKKK